MTVRLFVAVRPPPGVLPGVRNPHVTLRFLGAVDDGLVEEVAGALRAGLVGVGPCEAEIGTAVRRLGASALVVPVSGLEELAAAVAASVGRYGGDDRPFRAHLTVARVDRRAPRRRGPLVSAPAVDLGLAAPVPWTVDEVALVRSELGRGEGGTARHTDVAVVRLGG